MAKTYRTIATFIQGNAIGVVEEPVLARGVPRERRGELWRVKIGLSGRAGARSGPFPAGAFDAVVRELRAFLRKEGVG